MGNPSHLNYLKETGSVWFNPCYGIRGFWAEFNKVKEKYPDKPFDYVWRHRDLKRAKEIYATSIIAKASQLQERQKYWWIQKPQQDPPDGVMGTIVEKDGIQKMHVREVEVVEYLEGDILDTVKKKLAGKHYEQNTVLVCYLSAGGVCDFDELSEKFSNEDFGLNHIFLVFPGAHVSEIKTEGSKDEIARSMYKYSVVQLKPVYSFSTFDPIDDCAGWGKGDEPNYFIVEGIGKGGNRPISLEEPPLLF